MENPIKLLDNIIKNMEYIELLLTEGHKYVTPLNTFNLVMGKLIRLRVILDTGCLHSITPDQIREAVIRLEKPVEHTHEGTGTPTKIKDRLFKTGESYIGTPTETFTFTGDNPFYCDSVGGEESLCSS